MNELAIGHAAPRFSRKEAGRIALELYGVQAQVSELPSERDQNFLLSSPSGEKLVLKFANCGEDRRWLAFQNQAMDVVSADPAFPTVRRSLTGRSVETARSADGREFPVRLVSYLPGKLLVDAQPHPRELLEDLGRLLARLDRALQALPPPPVRSDLKWDLSRAEWIVDVIDAIEDPKRRRLVEGILRQCRETVFPAWPDLRQQVIHNDANDYNVVVENRGADGLKVSGLIDFGDMTVSPLVCEPAVASAYAMLEKPDPVACAAAIAAGYNAELPLTELELELLDPLIRLRLAVSVANSAWQRRINPENQYLQVTDGPAWELLEKLESTPSRLARCRFREACGLEPCPANPPLAAWLKNNRRRLGPVTGRRTDNALVFDLSAGSAELPGRLALGDLEGLEDHIFGRMRRADAEVGLGRYDEARLFYRSDSFSESDPSQRRTVHLGVDLFMRPGSTVLAPLTGTVHSFRDNAAPFDYGPTIILEHRVHDDISFFTLYGHLSRDSLTGLEAGQKVEKGQLIGRLGTRRENGGWPPHLHFQIISDLMGWSGDFPGVASPDQRRTWLSLCPHPGLILRLPADTRASAGLSKEDLLEIRGRRLGRSLSISYRKPLKIVRGWMQRLFDEEGRAYLDCVNNVAHVGHSHPAVVEAATRQMAVLNTNTRYLHDHLARYAERLCALFPDPLSVCYFVCSGSEANELALRLAQTWTGRRDVAVLEGAYHGNTGRLVEVSPYKFDGPGGGGAPSHVHKLPMPDVYRGKYRESDDPEAGRKYGLEAALSIAALTRNGRPPAALIYEPIMGCGGQIVPPPAYFPMVQQAVRDAGGVCIADEVQVGFGRVGSHWWGFELHGVAPDIVTLGKPIGNGHPMGAVVTTPEIADAFANGMEYFNSFGGNPVSCAVGMAVLDVIESERLRQHAAKVGEELKAGLRQLIERFPLVGDVRGKGLFLGIELVSDRNSRLPAQRQAACLVERMREKGILLSTDGPRHNVVKIKPPLPFSAEDASVLVESLEAVLQEDSLAASECG